MAKQILGIVKADSQQQADHLLFWLEGISCFDIIDEIPAENESLNINAYDAFVDNEGYLTLAEDYGNLAKLDKQSGGKFRYIFSGFYMNEEEREAIWDAG